MFDTDTRHLSTIPSKRSVSGETYINYPRAGCPDGAAFPERSLRKNIDSFGAFLYILLQKKLYWDIFGSL